MVKLWVVKFDNAYTLIATTYYLNSHLLQFFEIHCLYFQHSHMASHLQLLAINLVSFPILGIKCQSKSQLYNCFYLYVYLYSLIVIRLQAIQYRLPIRKQFTMYIKYLCHTYLFIISTIINGMSFENKIISVVNFPQMLNFN